MERAHNLLHEFIHTKGKIFEDFRLHLDLDGNEKEERATTKTGYKTLHIRATTPLAALFALHRFQISFLSQRPLQVSYFNDRLFWPVKGLQKSLEDPKNLDTCCQRIIELGYNGLILQGIDPSLPQSYGLKVFQEIGQDQLNTPWLGDGVIVKLDEKTLPKLKYSTAYERLLAKIQAMEQQIPKKAELILVLPPCSIQDDEKIGQFLALMEETAPQTKIAFLANSGLFFEDFEPPHPLFGHLQTKKDTLCTPLLPIINGGLIQYGEGLWPVFPFDSIDLKLSLPPSGGICLASALPERSGLLDCSLWVTSHAFLTHLPADILAETWFLAHKPHVDFSSWRRLILEGRAIVKELLRFQRSAKDSSKEVLKIFAESLFSRMRLFQEETASYPDKKGETPSLHEYVTFFIRDAKRIFSSLLEKYHLSLPFRPSQVDEELEGFWTTKGAPPFILESPFQGGLGTRMEKIFLENRKLPKEPCF